MNGELESWAGFGPPTATVTQCCARFYESPIATYLLGESFHPGGTRLTHALGESLSLGEDQVVLDLACGRGTSAVYLASTFGCRVVALDYSPANVRATQALADEAGLRGRVQAVQANGERLPFGAAVFDAIVCECAFCTFPNKVLAAAEMRRVLRGQSPRLGISDVTLARPLPPDLAGLVSWVLCIADARPASEYRAILETAGFGDIVIADHSWALRAMANEVGRKLLAAEVAVKFGALQLPAEWDIEQPKRLLQQVQTFIVEGGAGYHLLVAGQK